MSGKKIAIVATSSNVTLLKNGMTRPSGCWYEELATPYMTFIDAGFQVQVYSVKGGGIPFDSGSMGGDFFTETCKRFAESEHALKACNTKSVKEARDEILQCDALYMPGGHGCYGDFQDPDLCAVIATFYNAGKPVGVDCHGPVCLANDALKKSDGTPLVQGHEVACFTDAEEKAVGALETIPWSMEQKLKELGAVWKGGPDWAPNAVVSGNLITGQNPASSLPVAQAVVQALQ